MGGVWPHGSTPDLAVQVWALAGDIVLCSWARHLTLKLPLSTQVYKWVPANLMLGVTLRWTSIPSRGGGGRRKIPSRFMLWKPGYAPAWWATWLVCRLYLLSCLKVESEKLQQMYESGRDRYARTLNLQAQMDERELQQVAEDKRTFLKTAVEYYIKTLETGVG